MKKPSDNYKYICPVGKYGHLYLQKRTNALFRLDEKDNTFYFTEIYLPAPLLREHSQTVKKFYIEVKKRMMKKGRNI